MDLTRLSISEINATNRLIIYHHLAKSHQHFINRATILEILYSYRMLLTYRFRYLQKRDNDNLTSMILLKNIIYVIVLL